MTDDSEQEDDHLTPLELCGMLEEHFRQHPEMVLRPRTGGYIEGEDVARLLREWHEATKPRLRMQAMEEEIDCLRGGEGERDERDIRAEMLSAAYRSVMAAYLSREDFQKVMRGLEDGWTKAASDYNRRFRDAALSPTDGEEGSLVLTEALGRIASGHVGTGRKDAVDMEKLAGRGWQVERLYRKEGDDGETETVRCPRCGGDGKHGMEDMMWGPDCLKCNGEGEIEVTADPATERERDE